MRSVILILLLALAGCSTHTISIGPDSITATSTSFLYCPEARIIRAQDGKRTVDMVGEASGVGAVVTGGAGAVSTPICIFHWPEWGCNLVTPLYMTCMEMDEIMLVTNGCGRAGVEETLVPDSIFGLDISHVCRVHDVMYQYADSLEDENFADAIFGANLISLIRQKTKWRIMQWLRLRRAYKYIDAVALTDCVSVAMMEQLGIRDMVC